MNILWISHIIPYPPKTGVLQRSYNLLKETSKLGNVFLFALHKHNVLPIEYDVESVKIELKKLCKHIEIFDIPVELSAVRFYTLLIKSLFTTEPLSVSYYNSNEMKRKILNIISKVDFDIAYFDTISLVPYSRAMEKIKKILNHHNIESDLLEKRSYIEKNLLKKYYYKFEAKQLMRYLFLHCRQFNTHFVVSDIDKNLLKQVDPELHIEIIPNGVDTDYFYYSQKKLKERNLTIVSGMNWYPNRDAVEYMCDEIWPLLSQKFTDITLTVVGSHPPHKLLDLAKNDNRITVTGFVDDVRPFIQEAEIYLCPMRDGGGTRLKILDAMSMGKTIVSTTKGCEGIDVTPDKDVLIADSPSQFLSKISMVFQNSELRKKIGGFARTLAEDKYSWKTIGKSLFKVYSKLY